MEIEYEIVLKVVLEKVSIQLFLGLVLKGMVTENEKFNKRK